MPSVPLRQKPLEKLVLFQTIIPAKFIAEGVLDALAQHHKGIENLAGLNILIPRAMQAREFLPEALTAAGACVQVVPCYQMSREEMNPDIIETLA